MKGLLLATVFTVATTVTGYAQFGSGIVYDPTQSAHAVQ
jgi:hypothetical protein